MATQARSRVLIVLAERKQTVAEFCRALEISRSLPYLWASGARNPLPKHRRAAAAFLGVSEEALFLPDDSPCGDVLSPCGDSPAPVTA